MGSFMTDFFYLQRFQGLSVLYRVSSLHYFLLLNRYFIVQLYRILFIHSLVDGYLSYFYFLTIMNKATINIYVHICVWISVCICLGYIPWSGIAGSYGSWWFKFLRNSKLFQNGCAILYSPQQCVSDVVSLHPHQNLVLSLFFFILGILIDMQ